MSAGGGKERRSADTASCGRRTNRSGRAGLWPSGLPGTVAAAHRQATSLTQSVGHGPRKRCGATALPGRLAFRRALNWSARLLAQLEITDLLWPAGADGGRLPAVKAEVMARLAGLGQRRAARIVARMPSVNVFSMLVMWTRWGFGCIASCSALVRSCSSVAVSPRCWGRWSPISAGGVVVLFGWSMSGAVWDFVVRWLSATAALGGDVELVGVDTNPVLVAEAGLAEREGWSCRFVRGDAFEPDVAVEEGARTVVISSGLMHHLPEPVLEEFFAGQARLGVAAFAHWDIGPCVWSTLGAWVFHQARMR